jgi:ribosome-associated protein
VNLPLFRRSIRSTAQLGFSRSGGPGGQNVNKVNTKVTLHINLAELEGLTGAETERLREVLGSRITGPADSAGILVITSSEERSQKVNLERAYARAETLIENAARLPKKRRTTKPSRAAKERRLQSKRRHSDKKENRKPLMDGFYS